MHTSAPPHPYKHHRFPAEIISHGVWLYFRFCLSYRDVEELLFACGIIGFILTKVRKLSQNSASTALCSCHRFHDPWFLNPTFLQLMVQIRLRRLVAVGDKLLG
jgi:putative transposase